MKKSSFIALVLGTVSTVLFALGMCMTLIPEWNAMKPGIIFGVVGIVLALITMIVWRKMEHKAPIHVSAKTVLAIVVAVIGSLMLGVGMCFCMVWSNIVLGIVIGLVGIVILLTLVPLIKGLKD